jgi:hypothetical protein
MKENYTTGTFNEMVGEWRELVERAAAQGPAHVVTVQFRHHPNVNLIPILTELYAHGICVVGCLSGAVLAVGRDHTEPRGAGTQRRHACQLRRKTGAATAVPSPKIGVMMITIPPCPRKSLPGW